MEYPAGTFLNKPGIMHVPRQLQGLGLGRKEGGSLGVTAVTAHAHPPPGIQGSLAEECGQVALEPMGPGRYESD